MILTKASIDNMSIMTQLQKYGIDFGCYDYLAFGSASSPAAGYHWDDLKVHNTIIIGTDRDTAGLECRTRLHSELRDRGFTGKILHVFPQGKDFNQDLTAYIRFDIDRFPLAVPRKQAAQKQEKPQINPEITYDRQRKAVGRCERKERHR